MAFSKDTIDRVRDATSMISVIGNIVKLKSLGQGKAVGRCPFHSEKTPSFNVNEYEKFYKCFGCGESGDVFTFVQKTHHINFTEAVEMLAGQSGIALEKETPANIEARKTKDRIGDIMEFTVNFFQQNLQADRPECKKALAYLSKKRGLKPSTIKDFRLGYAPKGGFLGQALVNSGFNKQDIYDSAVVKSIARGEDFFENRVMIPIWDSKGNIVGFGGRTMLDDKSEAKYINSRDSLLFKKSSLLYNFKDAKKNAMQNKKHLVVVEGYMDTIAMAQFGLNYCVAPLGTSITEEQVRTILSCDKSPIICLNGDEAGIKASVKIANIMLKLVVPEVVPKFVLLTDYNDLDDMLKSFSSPADAKFNAEKMLENAIELQDFLFLQVAKNVDSRNPNSMAALEKRVAELCGGIADPIIQSNYRRFFKDKIYEMRRIGNGDATGFAGFGGFGGSDRSNWSVGKAKPWGKSLRSGEEDAKVKNNADIIVYINQNPHLFLFALTIKHPTILIEDPESFDKYMNFIDDSLVDAVGCFCGYLAENFPDMYDEDSDGSSIKELYSFEEALIAICESIGGGAICDGIKKMTNGIAQLYSKEYLLHFRRVVLTEMLKVVSLELANFKTKSFETAEERAAEFKRLHNQESLLRDEIADIDSNMSGISF